MRDLEAAKVELVSVPEDFLLGRVLAKGVVNPETGEVIANANDEITETMLADLRAANISHIHTLFINHLARGGYISQTLRTDETADPMPARLRIHRMEEPRVRQRLGVWFRLRGSPQNSTKYKNNET